jgi:hypothetical protein
MDQYSVQFNINPAGNKWPNMIPDMTDYDSLRFACSLYAVSR